MFIFSFVIYSVALVGGSKPPRLLSCLRSSDWTVGKRNCCAVCYGETMLGELTTSFYLGIGLAKISIPLLSVSGPTVICKFYEGLICEKMFA